MDAIPTNGRRKTRLDLVHLRSLSLALPKSDAGKVVAAWADIEAGFARGMRMREVWDAAVADGLEIPYAQFRVYVSRQRRKLERMKPQPRRAVNQAVEPLDQQPDNDPFKNLRTQREKRRSTGFDYDPISTDKNLIE